MSYSVRNLKSQLNPSEKLHANIKRNSYGPKGCGVNSRSNTRIVAGQPADSKQWPWMVALLRENMEHYCGGVLITDRHILTAAHCVKKLVSYQFLNLNKHFVRGFTQVFLYIIHLKHHIFCCRWRTRDITIRLGEYDFRNFSETRSFDFKVAEIRMHRDFNDGTYENDIAIIKIHRPTIFNTFVWPVCLPPVGVTFENKTAIVIGMYCTI